MKIKSQAGFTLVEGLLMLIALVLIGFTGFYVYNADKNTGKTVARGSSAVKAGPAKPARARYLEIKELGIKLPLNGKLAGLDYELAPDQSIVGLSTKSFENAVADCKSADTASASFPAIGSVTKISGTYDPNAMPQDVFSEFAVQLDGFYLTYGAPDGGYGLYCNVDSQVKRETVQNLGNQLSPAIKEAVEHAKQI